MNRDLAQHVRLRASERCEYCRVPESAWKFRFQIDHVIARQHDGPTVAENLAFCCPHCNRHKGSNLSGIDPASRLQTRLFNPRTDAWDAHFRWEGATIAGTSPIGRATVKVLAMNDLVEVARRQPLVRAGIIGGV
jgi:hypothetical protein